MGERFVSGPVHVGFMVDKVQLGKVFLRLLRFPPASVITLCSVLILLITLFLIKTSGPGLQTYKESNVLFTIRGSLDIKQL